MARFPSESGHRDRHYCLLLISPMALWLGSRHRVFACEGMGIGSDRIDSMGFSANETWEMKIVRRRFFVLLVF